MLPFRELDLVVFSLVKPGLSPDEAGKLVHTLWNAKCELLHPLRMIKIMKQNDLLKFSS